MVDLIVPAGTVLDISQASQIAPHYGLFRMEANAKIVASIDLTIKASRAEFAEGCIIDAHGAAGANGSNGFGGPPGSGSDGGPGNNGLPGKNGRNVSIEAGLAKVGGLIIITNGRCRWTRRGRWQGCHRGRGISWRQWRQRRCWRTRW